MTELLDKPFDNKPMRYLSLFSGIGGFELGIKRACSKLNALDPVCVGYAETDDYAAAIYERHFRHPALGDVTRVRCEDLPDFDVLVGGFPCQAFSLAGKMDGFGDKRGTLFAEIARIARQKRPRFLLLENVKGLLSHDEGRTFLSIVT